MKKLLTILVALMLSITACFALTACGGGNNVANEIEGVGGEEFGFIVGKNSTNKVAILSAMNKVIGETDIEEVINYYTAIFEEQTPATTLTMPNLDDNTGGTLKVYTESGFAPFEFIDENNNVIGVDMYLMALVCEELNMKLHKVH